MWQICCVEHICSLVCINLSFYQNVQAARKTIQTKTKSKIMKNRRCTKFYHKKYRRYASDIWGRLAIKKRDNFITKLVSSYAQSTLRRRLKSFTALDRKQIWKRFKRSKLKTPRFAFQINTRAIQNENVPLLDADVY